ncbi:hypothetical protein LGZ99_19270 [Photorhabdus temperata]|nr:MULTISPECIES: hypothetical protein [Photorhabdus]MCT8349273.1 hypothetical protein [Photorhabdus temperata]
MRAEQDENRLPWETHLDALTISISRLKRRNWTKYKKTALPQWAVMR